MKNLKENIKKIVPLLFVVVLSCGAIWPLFHSGFFPMHDDTQVARVFEMGMSLKDGMLPVRWVTDLGYGYGYPIFNFYAPLAYYIGGAFALFLNPLFATKIMIALGMVCSGVTIYFLAKNLWGRSGGVLSAFLYMYAPYHAVDLYVRGDIGEVFAYVFFPLALLGVWKIYKDPSWKTIALGAVGFAGVIVSHNLSALIFAPFLLLSLIMVAFFGIVQKKNVWVYALLLFSFGILLSCWYSLPAILEMHYTNVLSQIGGGANFHDHFVCIQQLWQSPWGYGGSTKGCIDGFSFMIGKLQILFGVLGAISGIIFWKKSREKALIILFCFVCTGVSIFLLLPNAVAIWNAIPFMAFLQYPWRYLLMVSLFLSLLGGSSAVWLIYISKKISYVIIFLLAIGIVLFSLKYFVPQTFLPADSSYYTNKTMVELTTSKISDEYMPKNFQKPQSAQQLPQSFITLPKESSGSVKILLNTTQKKEFTLTVPAETKLSLNIAYFPAWQLTLDGKKVPLMQTATGMAFTASKGMHNVFLSFHQTNIELFADGISLAGVLIMILGIIYL